MSTNEKNQGSNVLINDSMREARDLIDRMARRLPPQPWTIKAKDGGGAKSIVDAENLEIVRRIYYSRPGESSRDFSWNHKADRFLEIARCSQEWVEGITELAALYYHGKQEEFEGVLDAVLFDVACMSGITWDELEKAVKPKSSFLADRFREETRRDEKGEIAN